MQQPDKFCRPATELRKLRVEQMELLIDQRERAADGVSAVSAVQGIAKLQEVLGQRGERRAKIP